MSANISKILELGATSGLDEAFAKHFHAHGKTVIAAGRRLERLNSLKAQLSGLETVQIDFEDVLRTQTAGSNVPVIDLVPPYVDTDLDSHFREKIAKLQGIKGHLPMPLEEYMEKVKSIIRKAGVKEVAVGSADIGVNSWRSAFGPLLEIFGLAG